MMAPIGVFEFSLKQVAALVYFCTMFRVSSILRHSSVIRFS